MEFTNLYFIAFIFILILIAVLVTLIVSIIRKNKRSVILLSFTLFLMIVAPIALLFSLFSEPHVKVKELGNFRKEIVNKYDYVKQVQASNYRNRYFKVIIRTTKNLDWDEMKGIYIDVREFLLSDNTQRELKQFCDKEYKGNSSFNKVGIEFDFESDGYYDVQIDGYLDDEIYSAPWYYWNYGDTSLTISPEGEIIQ